MNRIQVLDSLVADMIAAGEVVERPASVVKELAENAIDAGAGKITIEINQGGKSFIRICDDGSGIAAEDLEVAFYRHATSKISGPDDLYSIHTLGFRGEALASIAAVSQMEVITKPRLQDFGMFLSIKAAEVLEKKEIGSPDGTTMTVRNLFYNVPARMKFLKKDAAETAAAAEVVEHLALGNPQISFRFIADGREKLYTPGDGSLKSCIYSIYGREYAEDVAQLNYKSEGIAITGFCGKPSLARSTRSYQTFFVNGRYIKSRSMTYALEQAYQDGMMKGKYPFVVANVSISPTLADVNVHPAKLEVKFSNEKAVTTALYWSVKNALHQSSYVPRVEAESFSPPEPKPVTTPEKKPLTLRQDKVPYGTEVYSQPRIPSISKLEPTDQCQMEARQPAPADGKKEAETKAVINSLNGSAEKLDMHEKQYTPEDQNSPETQSSTEGKIKEESQETKQRPAEVLTKQNKAAPPVTVVGQIFQSYIVAQRGDEMLLIDQHAAHERLLFEQLVANKEPPAVQTFLSPVIIRMSKSEYERVAGYLELLRGMGFDIEDFGSNSMILRAAPLATDKQDIEGMFWEIVHKTETIDAGRPRDEVESEMLYSLACHAALKANRTLNRLEMEKFVQDVMKLPDTCPHGRPITVSISQKTLEKQFKRIV